MRSSVFRLLFASASILLFVLGCAAAAPPSIPVQIPQGPVSCGELRVFDPIQKECTCAPTPYILSSPHGEVPINTQVLSPDGQYKAGWVEYGRDPTTGESLKNVLQIRRMDNAVAWQLPTEQRKGFAWSPSSKEFMIVDHYENLVSELRMFHIEQPNQPIQTIRMSGSWPHVIAFPQNGDGALLMLDDCRDPTVDRIMLPRPELPGVR